MWCAARNKADQSLSRKKYTKLALGAELIVLEILLTVTFCVCSKN